MAFYPFPYLFFTERRKVVHRILILHLGSEVSINVNISNLDVNESDRQESAKIPWRAC